MEGPLNIISNSVRSGPYGGPGKVFENTLRGLDKINYPYVVNMDPGNYRLNWVHDSMKGLIEVSIRKIPAIVGPNIAVLPSNLPGFRPDLGRCLYLHPSKWCVDLWKVLKFDECPLYSWPAGIDTDSFQMKRGSGSKGRVMIYFKRRDNKLLEETTSCVLKLGLVPVIIKYGEYTEEQYKKVLSSVEFGIWIGISESQGIGLQEALASGLPLIVWDVNSLFESADSRDHRFDKVLCDFRPTSVPYFDSSCGIVINEASGLSPAIRNMINNIEKYKPGEFVKENLSLEKQALELISFFKILRQKYPEYFFDHTVKNANREFRLSPTGKIIYLMFLLRRKINTTVSWLVKKVI